MRLRQRSAVLLVAAGSALILTAQVALAGSGTGVINLPNPLAPVMPVGVTERALREVNCSRLPDDDVQGYDAWVAPLAGRMGNHFAVGTESLPDTSVGYTFHVGFYSYLPDKNQCHWVRGVVALGNPTPALKTFGADYAVISVLVGHKVLISWKECSSTPCVP